MTASGFLCLDLNLDTFISKPENINTSKQLLWPSLPRSFSPCLVRFDKDKQVPDSAPWMEHPGCTDRLEQGAGEMTQEGCWHCPGSQGWALEAARAPEGCGHQGCTGGIAEGLQGQELDWTVLVHPFYLKTFYNSNYKQLLLQ